MQEFNYKGQNNRFKIIHHKADINDNVSMAFLKLGKGEIEIFYHNLDDYKIIPEETIIFQVFDKDGTVKHLYLLSRLQVMNQGVNFIKYKIGHGNIYYSLEDDL